MNTLIVLCLLCVSSVVVGELEWWQKTIVYQIYPRSFKDTDGNGYGDLQGVREKLDYIQGLGIDTIWLSPIYPSPGADAGYDISNFEDIDPLFGNMADFDKLLEDCHNRGMYVVLDYVPNHSSDEHPWFIESVKAEPNQYTDYYVWADGKPDPDDPSKTLPPNNWLANFGGGSMWTYVESRKKYYLHQFHEKQPDLNFRNPAVVAEMKSVLRFWLDKGVDGFRMDTVPSLFEDEQLRDEPMWSPDLDPNDRGSYNHIYSDHLPESIELIQQFRTVLDEYRFTCPQQPFRAMMIEAYASIPTTMKWYGTYDREGANFPFNFGLITTVNGGSKAQDFIRYITEYLAELPVKRWPDWVIGNHDQRRVSNRYGADKVDILNAVNLLLPGTAVTYLGEELGMQDNTDITFEQGQDPQGCNAGPDGYAGVTRDFQRSPFQWDNTTNAGFSSAQSTWLPVNKNYLTLNAKFQQEADESHLKFYRQLAQLRQLPSVREGQLYVNSYGDQVVIIVRELQGSNNVTGILNLGSTQVDVNVSDVLGDRFNNYNLIAKSVGSSLSLGSELNPRSFVVPGYTAAIFETNSN